MIADFLTRMFGADKPAPLTELDTRLALAALLVRAGKADERYRVEEIAKIDKLLAARFGLNPVEAAKLRADAEAVEHDAPDTVRFTRAVKDGVPYEDRAGVIEALWDVVLADGIRAHADDALMRMVLPAPGGAISTPAPSPASG